MEPKAMMKMLCKGTVIPAVRGVDDFKHALANTESPSVVLLFGDINTLPELLQQAKQHKKRLLIHLDFIEGIGKDKPGINYLARLGVTAVITTKSHLARIAREEGMIVIQRLFLVDSEALKTGIHLLKGFKPDAVEILPISVPEWVIRQLAKETGLPVMAGGLVRSQADVDQAVKNGACAVTTSRRELWQ